VYAWINIDKLFAILSWMYNLINPITSGINAILVSIPWYGYALLSIPAAIILYSTWWCIDRNLSDEDYPGPIMLFMLYGMIIGVIIATAFLFTQPADISRTMVNFILVLVITFVCGPITGVLIFIIETLHNHHKRITQKSVEKKDDICENKPET
jgi:hypothetical protein